MTLGKDDCLVRPLILLLLLLLLLLFPLTLLLSLLRFRGIVQS
jgi:hypothetical protein